MEIGIDEKICTYSGGLGILAGDTIRSAADLRMPMVSVTLLYRKGYFRQRLEADGWQREEPTLSHFRVQKIGGDLVAARALDIVAPGPKVNGPLLDLDLSSGRHSSSGNFSKSQE